MNELYDTIYIIGKGRFIKLLTLIILNVALFVGIFLYLEPETIKREQQVNEVTMDNIRLRTEIDAMPAMLVQYKENEKNYEELLKTGFVGDQDRIVARKLIDYSRTQSGILGVEYEFSPLKHFENDVRTISFPNELVQSDMKFTINSTLDLEAFAFMQYLEETLPGVLIFRKMVMYRDDTPIDKTSLAMTGMGEKISFINALLEYEWLTLSPKPKEIQQSQL